MMGQLLVCGFVSVLFCFLGTDVSTSGAVALSEISQ